MGSRIILKVGAPSTHDVFGLRAEIEGLKAQIAELQERPPERVVTVVEKAIEPVRPDPEIFDEPEAPKPDIIREDVPYTSQQASLLQEQIRLNHMVQRGEKVDQAHYDAIHAGIEWLRRKIEIV